MRKIKNVLICGIGAIGSIYADKIQKYSPDNLKILVDENRLRNYQKTPLIFNGNELKLNYILPEYQGFKADLVIIATKFDGLNSAINGIKNFVKEDTIILSLLNGVTSEDIIAAVYGWKRVVYSYIIGHSAVRNGRNVTHDDVCKIVFGSKDADNENVESIKEFFERVGINYEIPEDIIHSLWLKYLLNVSTNQSSAILGMTFGQMQSNKKFLLLMQNIMKEVIAIAKAEGVKHTERLLEETIEAFNTMSPAGKTSMLQDVEAGRKTELEIFASTVVEFGKKHNIPTPYNTVLKAMIETIHENIETEKLLP